MSKNSKVMMFWALNDNRELKTINEVENGKTCNCTCLECGAPVWARNGGDPAKKAFHFYHAPGTGKGCSGESVLHYAAKYILKEELDSGRTLYLPLELSHLSRYDFSLVLDKESSSFLSTQTIVEKQISRQIRTDVWALREDGFALAIEIYVTHKKSEDDIQKFKEQEQNAIEVDISKLSWNASRNQIAELVFSPSSSAWLFFNKIHEYEQEELNRQLLIKPPSIGSDEKKAREFKRQRLNKAKPTIRQQELFESYDSFPFGRSFDVKLKQFINGLENDMPKFLGKAVYFSNGYRQMDVELTSFNKKGYYNEFGYAVDCVFNKKIVGKLYFCKFLKELNPIQPTGVFFLEARREGEVWDSGLLGFNDVNQLN